MPLQVLIAGGGIGGLAAALACARAGHVASVHEQADVFREAGAGIQLGPNAVRILNAWGLATQLDANAARPARLNIRRAEDDVELAAMPLRGEMERRYGAPYLTIHRADLQAILLEASLRGGVSTQTSARIVQVQQDDAAVAVQDKGLRRAQGDALIAADGIWSELRRLVDPHDATPASPTGHVAFRALAPQQALPASCRSDDVTVWLGPRLHVVAYPVRGGEWLNMVALVEADTPVDATDWDAAATAGELFLHLGRVSHHLRERMAAMPVWGRWTLHDRTPLRRARQMASGRIALLGDAAHPMLPYLAQGAGMAIEDASVLADSLLHAGSSAGVPEALQAYARRRWERCARVQQLARRNAVIFHARGPLAWGRDLALRTLRAQLLDQPWLYGST